MSAVSLCSNRNVDYSAIKGRGRGKSTGGNRSLHIYLLYLIKNHLLSKSVQETHFKQNLIVAEIITTFCFLMELNLLIDANCDPASCKIAVIICDVFVLCPYPVFHQNL